MLKKDTTICLICVTNTLDYQNRKNINEGYLLVTEVLQDGSAHSHVWVLRCFGVPCYRVFSLQRSWAPSNSPQFLWMYWEQGYIRGCKALYHLSSFHLNATEQQKTRNLTKRGRWVGSVNMQRHLREFWLQVTFFSSSSGSTYSHLWDRLISPAKKEPGGETIINRDCSIALRNPASALAQCLVKVWT